MGLNYFIPIIFIRVASQSMEALRLNICYSMVPLFFADLKLKNEKENSLFSNSD